MSFHRLLQLTDPHIFADISGKLNGVNVRKSFLAVLQQALDENRPDYILLTGDITHDGLQESYRWLYSVMDETGIKWSWLPGNHDAATMMTKKFIRKVHLDRWRLLQLDSNVPGHSYGELSEDELAFLHINLQKNTASPVLILVHHHVCDINSAMDDGRIDSNAMFDILSRYTCVKAVIHGHIHQEWDSLQGHIRILGAPSTCVQFLPGAKTFLLDKKKGPGYRVFTLYSNGEFDTEVRRIKGDCFLPSSAHPLF